MRLYNDISSLNNDDIKKAVYTVGNFDGVHLGHRRLFQVCKSRSIENNSKFVVITFSNHPKDLFFPDKPVDKITDLQQRKQLISECGADYLIVLDFDWQLASLEAKPFLDLLCVNREQVDFYIGKDFNFGSKKKGNPAFISDYLTAAGLGKLHVVPSVRVLSHKVSSTSIRRKIRLGKVSEAAMLLGRPYCLKGQTAPGEKIGRQLGFPTLNLSSWETVLPESGVYATKCELGDKNFPAVTYVGLKPTFKGRELVVETHLLNTTIGDVYYGHPLKVHFLHRIRGDRCFNSTNELIEQMNIDIKKAENLINC